MATPKRTPPQAAPKSGDNNKPNHSPCANIAREWMDVIQWKPSMDRVFAQAEAQQNEIAAQSIHMIHRNCIELHTLTKVATEYSIAVLANAAGLRAPLPLPIEA